MDNSSETLYFFLALVWMTVSIAVCWFAASGFASHLLKEPKSSERLREYRRRLDELERQYDLDLQRAFEQSPDNPYDEKYTRNTSREIREVTESLSQEEDYRSKRYGIAIAAAVLAWFILAGLMIELGYQYY